MTKNSLNSGNDSNLSNKLMFYCDQTIYKVHFSISPLIFLKLQVTSLLATKDIDIITPFDYKLYKEDDVVLRIFVRKPT